MVEIIVGTYGVVCWLVLVKFKVVPVNAYTIFTAIAGGVVILVVLYILLSVYHPSATTGGCTPRWCRSSRRCAGW